MEIKMNWKGKKVLVTGHTGFKGSWLSLWLKKLGAKVYGVSLDPITNPSLFAVASVKEEIEKDSRIDIRNLNELKTFFQEVNQK
jgi:CDP-glucose 4,6-dehydratase